MDSAAMARNRAVAKTSFNWSFMSSDDLNDRTMRLVPGLNHFPDCENPGASFRMEVRHLARMRTFRGLRINSAEKSDSRIVRPSSPYRQGSKLIIKAPALIPFNLIHLRFHPFAD